MPYVRKERVRWWSFFFLRCCRHRRRLLLIHSNFFLNWTRPFTKKNFFLFVQRERMKTLTTLHLHTDEQRIKYSKRISMQRPIFCIYSMIVACNFLPLFYQLRRSTLVILCARCVDVSEFHGEIQINFLFEIKAKQTERTETRKKNKSYKISCQV